MNNIEQPRIVIAATNSGAGKTTITNGILACLKELALNVQPYKIGPDYIDPGFHSLASEKQCHNLDTWLVPSEKIKEIFLQTATNSDIAVIEGVMGLYDGGTNGISSTATIAKLLQAPVVLVIDAKSMGDSAAAIALGFKNYDPELNFAGVIINRLGSDNHEKMVVEAISRLGIKILGCVRRNTNMAMPERHLGLTPTTENDVSKILEHIKDNIKKQVDVTEIYNIAKTAPSLQLDTKNIKKHVFSALKIGVAKDEVFSFYYPESLAVLSDYGAEIIEFSPLHDKKLPEVDALILGGGFPEMFVKELSQNKEMIMAIKNAAVNKMPIYAECGGFMYLCSKIIDFNAVAFEMVGLVPAECKMNNKLQTVGYVKARALKDNILCPKNEVIKGHEFHFSSMEILDDQHFEWGFEFEKSRTKAKYCSGFSSENILASYLHIHFAGNEELVVNFLNKAQEYKSRKD